jgi:hypothetical protein
MSLAIVQVNIFSVLFFQLYRCSGGTEKSETTFQTYFLYLWTSHEPRLGEPCH